MNKRICMIGIVFMNGFFEMNCFLNCETNPFHDADGVKACAKERIEKDNITSYYLYYYLIKSNECLEKDKLQSISIKSIHPPEFSELESLTEIQIEYNVNVGTYDYKLAGDSDYYSISNIYTKKNLHILSIEEPMRDKELVLKITASNSACGKQSNFSKRILYSMK